MPSTRSDGVTACGIPVAPELSLDVEISLSTEIACINGLQKGGGFCKW